MKNYSDEIIQRFQAQDPLVSCRNITFQVTDDCCLNCTYCYQIHKGHKMMSKEVAKAAVDLLFKLYYENNERMVINRHTHGLILDFIGGEPFMNVEVMDYIVGYFIEKCCELDHEWLTNFRISISTNGLLYFTSAVQTFINKYLQFISLNITLDGPKKLHDSCRIDQDGNGSYDRSVAAWNDWYSKMPAEFISTKVTIAPENLPILESTFDFFIEKGCTNIHANPIFEHKWTVDEARDYFVILTHIADKLLENDISSALFTEYKGKPLSENDTKNYCGGTSAMLAFDPDGLAYPCVRYMESSLGSSRPPIIIGNVNGIYNTPEYQAIYNDMQAVTRQSQSTQECLECPVASGCQWCSAFNYQETGSYNKRSTNICWMHRAESLANVYYWNHFYIKYNIKKNFLIFLPREIAEEIVPTEVYNSLCHLCLQALGEDIK